MRNSTTLDEQFQKSAKAFNASSKVPDLINAVRDLSSKKITKQDSGRLRALIMKYLYHSAGVIKENDISDRRLIADELIGFLDRYWEDKSGNKRLPNLIIAGFGKCGTSTAHSILAKSAEVEEGVSKEISFFNRLSVYPIDLYKALFLRTNAGFLLDSTPMYALLPSAQLQRLTDTAPDAHYIIFTRNPIKRAISGYYSPGRAALRERARSSSGGSELATCDLSLNREMDMLEDLLPSLKNGELSFDQTLRRLPTQHVFGGVFDYHIERLSTALGGKPITVLDAEKCIFSPDAEAHLQEGLTSAGLDIKLAGLTKARNVGREPKEISPQTVARLERFFSDHGA